eukprot:gene20275-50975_t
MRRRSRRSRLRRRLADSSPHYGLLPPIGADVEVRGMVRDGSVFDIPPMKLVLRAQLPVPVVRPVARRQRRPAAAGARRAAEWSARLRAAAAHVAAQSDDQQQHAEAYGAAPGDPHKVQEEMRDFTQRLMDMYRSKAGDVVDELRENLRFPHGRDPLSSLSVVAHALKQTPRVAAAYGDLSLAELIVLRGYTQKPSDGAWSDAALRKWAKWLCTLAAVCGAESPPQPSQVFRGLGGGGLPAAVVATHRPLLP